MGHEITVSILELPKGWPQNLKESGVKIHKGTWQGEDKKPVTLYSTEMRIPSRAIPEEEFLDILDTTARYWGSSGKKARFVKQLEYVTVSARGLDIEVSQNDDGLVVRSSNRFFQLPDQRWSRGLRAAIIDATIVAQVVETIKDILDGKSGAPVAKHIHSTLRHEDSYRSIYG